MIEVVIQGDTSDWISKLDEVEVKASSVGDKLIDLSELTTEVTKETDMEVKEGLNELQDLKKATATTAQSTALTIMSIRSMINVGINMVRTIYSLFGQTLPAWVNVLFGLIGIVLNTLAAAILASSNPFLFWMAIILGGVSIAFEIASAVAMATGQSELSSQFNQGQSLINSMESAVRW